MLLTVENITKHYRSQRREITAVNSVSLSIAAGETLGIAGASGSGKSTLARLLLRLIAPDAGRITFRNEDWLALEGASLRHSRATMQMVFQDIHGAFHPTATVEDVLGDPLRIQRIVSRQKRPAEIGRLLERVGLPQDCAAHRVHDLSGGQRQRVAIARALSTRPSLIVLDEAVSALDVQARNRILHLLVDLQKDDGISYLFISHDLAVLRAVSHRLAIMDAGRIVEAGPTADIIRQPGSAAGRALVNAVPRLMTGHPSENTIRKDEPRHEN